MDPWVIALVSVSAVLHLAWNVRLKTAGDPLRAATIGMLAGCVGIVPIGIAIWWLGGQPSLPVEGIALGLASGVVEAAYFILLAAAYRRGDLSVVYPVARGTAPLLAVVIGVGLFGERLGVAGSIGVVALLVGFLMAPAAVARDRPRPDRGGADARKAAGESAILFALATGVMIATYTAIDRIGTREIDVFTYAAILWLTCSVVLVGWVALVAGGDLLRYGPEASRRAAVGGHADAGGLPVHPGGIERGATLRCRATPRVGDGLRRGVGIGANGGGGRSDARPCAGSALRCSSSAGRCCWPSGAREAWEVGASRGRPGASSGRLDRWHATEHPPPAEPAVDEPDAGDHERSSRTRSARRRLLEDEVAERDADHRDEVGDQRRPRRAPVGEQPEDGQIGQAGAEDPEPQDGEDGLGVGACRSMGARTAARRCR